MENKRLYCIALLSQNAFTGEKFLPLESGAEFKLFQNRSDAEIHLRGLGSLTAYGIAPEMEKFVAVREAEVVDELWLHFGEPKDGKALLESRKKESEGFSWHVSQRRIEANAVPLGRGFYFNARLNKMFCHEPREEHLFSETAPSSSAPHQIELIATDFKAWFEFGPETAKIEIKAKTTAESAAVWLLQKMEEAGIETIARVESEDEDGVRYETQKIVGGAARKTAEEKIKDINQAMKELREAKKNWENLLKAN